MCNLDLVPLNAQYSQKDIGPGRGKESMQWWANLGSLWILSSSYTCPSIAVDKTTLGGENEQRNNLITQVYTAFLRFLIPVWNIDACIFYIDYIVDRIRRSEIKYFLRCLTSDQGLTETGRHKFIMILKLPAYARAKFFNCLIHYVYIMFY